MARFRCVTLLRSTSQTRSSSCQEAILSACTCAKVEVLNKDEYRCLKLVGSGDQKGAMWFYVEHGITDAIVIVHQLQEKHRAASKRSERPPSG